MYITWNVKNGAFICSCIYDFLYQDGAVAAFRKTYELTIAIGHKMDLVFHLIRIGLFYLDHDLITRNIDKAKR